MNNKLHLLLASSLLATSTIVVAQIPPPPAVDKSQHYPKNLFAVSQLHFDSVRSAHGPEWYLKSREAIVILSAVATYMGVNPQYVVLAQKAIPSASANGEETNYVLPVPSGYAYCGTRIRVTSIVPADGGRASTINVAVNPNELQMTTWTPVQGIGEGRSWAEGDVQVFGVKERFLDEFVKKGVCMKVTQQVGIWSCRGRATCTGVAHGDPSDAGQSTPDLVSGF